MSPMCSNPCKEGDLHQCISLQRFLVAEIRVFQREADNPMHRGRKGPDGRTKVAELMVGMDEAGRTRTPGTDEVIQTRASTGG